MNIYSTVTLVFLIIVFILLVLLPGISRIGLPLIPGRIDAIGDWLRSHFNVTHVVLMVLLLLLSVLFTYLNTLQLSIVGEWHTIDYGTSFTVIKDKNILMINGDVTNNIKQPLVYNTKIKAYVIGPTSSSVIPSLSALRIVYNSSADDVHTLGNGISTYFMRSV